ncbi:MAG: DUF3035 domain-containing protein [Alphaproteobacteria bacterium]|nr:DUF3035 domain-containing protein [Alphaproteobacteria bacterium]
MKRLYFAVPLLLLAACGETTVKETLGIDRRAPDEFRVVSRPPLSVPPQFDLRPPGINGVDVQSGTRDRAQSLVLGNDPGATAADTRVMSVSSAPAGASAASTPAESGFLQKAGASQADPNVKKDLAEKKINEGIEKEESSWWDKVTVLPENKEPVVKADAEADRIKKNQEEGKPVTEGDTPETGGGPVSVLKSWIGD